ncbi:MAG: hypothetical protein MUP66_00665 [Candidatus Nanohaloarchaeota archaeon QJJ-5]|nr:hypothetical protein [Candidatus Nanohaloarchaeota archaeon QJJ-5]
MERHQLWLYLATGMFGMIVGRLILETVSGPIPAILIPNITVFFGITGIIGLFMFKHQDALENKNPEAWIVLIMLVAMSMSLLFGVIGYQQLEPTTQTIKHMQV